MANWTIELNVAEFNKVKELVSSQGWYARPWREGMTGIASSAGLAAQRGAPVETGHLQGRIRTFVQKREFPTWIAIRNQARRTPKGRLGASGYPYPRLLAFSPKHHHRDWLIKAVGPVFGRAEQVLNNIGQRIARNWAAR